MSGLAGCRGIGIYTQANNFDHTFDWLLSGTRETYSAKRLHRDLADHEVQTTPYRVRTLRKKLGLRCKQKLKIKATTDSKHNLPVPPNILNREFTVNAPGIVWVSDITYIPTDEGWLYLAGVKDLFNGEVVDYAMNERMTKSLVIQALFRATVSKHPDHGLIAHSDRGGQGGFNRSSQHFWSWRCLWDDQEDGCKS